MRIDYHKWNAFKECPSKFYQQYVEKKPSTIPVNDYHKLYGVLVQKFFEMYCNIWRFKTPYLFPVIIRERLEILYEGLLNHSTVNWSDKNVTKTKDQIFADAFVDICNICESHNQNYFLNTKSEVKIEVTTKDGDVINGRVDFIHHPPLSEDLILIDGKGTNKLNKNINKDQLFFYTLLCLFKYNIMPTEIGFFYYKFNTFAPVPIDKDSLNKFRAGLSLDIKSMTSSTEYRTTPSAKACKYCLYRNVCQDGLISKAKRAKKSNIEIAEGDGLVSFGF